MCWRLQPYVIQVQQLAVEGVFIYGAGAKPITDFIEEKVALSGNGGVIVDGACATSVQGVYAIGDICDKPHRQYSSHVAYPSPLLLCDMCDTPHSSP